MSCVVTLASSPLSLDPSFWHGRPIFKFVVLAGYRVSAHKSTAVAGDKMWVHERGMVALMADVVESSRPLVLPLPV